MNKRSGGVLHGWPIVGFASLAILAAVLLALATAVDPIEGVRRAVRLTARTSVTLFLLAFTASAVWRFWPNAWTRWQRQNRRYIGVSFAASHTIHLAAILTLAQLAPELVIAETSVITWVFGGLAYGFIAAMTVTSFDRTTRMIGPRAWTILHTTGSYYIWFIFANSYIGRAVMDPAYIPAAALVISGLALRIAVRIARSRAQAPAVAVEQ